MSSPVRSPQHELAESETSPPAPLLVTVKQACEMLSLGRTSIYHLVCSGQLKPKKIGGALRFSVEHLREFANGDDLERCMPAGRTSMRGH
jgi:excisionase family DNA binding protein